MSDGRDERRERERSDDSGGDLEDDAGGQREDAEGEDDRFEPAPREGGTGGALGPRGQRGNRKTTVRLQFLNHALENGENAVFITLEETASG